MKRKLIKALVVLILLGAGGIAYQFYQTKQQSDALAFEAVDMNRLQDGSYEGECQTGLVQVRLRLRIQNAAIQRIELLQHDNGMGKDAERILEDIQKQNSTAVDDVSSATISSRAIRMAAQNALKKAALRSKAAFCIPPVNGERKVRLG